MLISFNKSEYISVPEFFEKEANKWNYFLAYVNLLADICVDRNSEAIEYVSNILILQNAAIILFDDQVDKINDTVKKLIQRDDFEGHFEYINMRAPFIRICHNVYINNHKFAPIKKVKKISLWYKKVEEGEVLVHEINRTKRVFEGEK